MGRLKLGLKNVGSEGRFRMLVPINVPKKVPINILTLLYQTKISLVGLT